MVKGGDTIQLEKIVQKQPVQIDLIKEIMQAILLKADKLETSAKLLKIVSIVPNMG